MAGRVGAKHSEGAVRPSRFLPALSLQRVRVRELLHGLRAVPRIDGTRVLPAGGLLIEAEHGGGEGV